MSAKEREQHETEVRREGRRRRFTTFRTTGILQNNQPTAVEAHVELFNPNPEAVQVRVQVLNWGTAVTQTGPVSTLLDFNELVAGNTRTALNATVPRSNHYEVRVTVGDFDENVVVNTYARTGAGTGIVNGLTVFNSELTTVEIERGM
jgi:hypothetical protein